MKEEEDEKGRRKRKKNERSIEGKNVGQDRDARRGVGWGAVLTTVPSGALRESLLNA